MKNLSLYSAWENRFFAALRMTRGGAQNDKGVGAECQRGNAQCQWVLPVILRNEVTKNLSLCLSREGSFFAALRMTRGSTQHDKGVGAECQRGNAQCQWVLPVILRNEVTKNLSLCLSREGRFFAALRMTRGSAQNDKGGVLSMTWGRECADLRFLIKLRRQRRPRQRRRHQRTGPEWPRL